MLSQKKRADQILRLENQLCFALYSTSLAMTKTYKPMLDAIGLLTRQRDTEDERRVRVKLTAAGNSLRAKATDIPLCVQDITGCPLLELISLGEKY